MNYEDRVTKSYLEDAIAAKCEVVFGAYVGNDASEREITLGFRPKAVFFSGSGQFNTSGGFFTAEHGLGPAFAPNAAVTDTGFAIKTSTLNSSRTEYIYVAFR